MEFKIGDLVYAESRSRLGHLYQCGIAVIVHKNTNGIMYKVDFIEPGYKNVDIGYNHPQWKYDILRKLTKLELALQ